MEVEKQQGQKKTGRGGEAKRWGKRGIENRKGKESKQGRSSAELLLGGRESNMIQRQEGYRQRWRGRQTH